MRAEIAGMVGRRFGCWIVESRAKNRSGEVQWNCLCDCGRRYAIYGYSLRTGVSSKCRYCRATLPEGIAARNSTLRGYQYAAKQRGLVWDLDDAAFDALSQAPCHYCGGVRVNKAQGKVTAWRYNGIDRKDSTQGYTKENSVSCCGLCNRWKSDLSTADFQAHARKIVTMLEK